MQHVYFVNKRKQSGFIMLFFVLGISVTMLLWIGVSSSDLFDYLKKRKDFEIYRDGVRDLISCADVVISRSMSGDILPGTTDIFRQLYFDDRFMCKVYDLKKITIDQFSYSIQFNIGQMLKVSVVIRNGFVVSSTSLYVL